jgi:polar amino acid transport system substrate-binding protein
MKKLVKVLSLVLAFSFILSACGTKETGTKNVTTEPTSDVSTPAADAATGEDTSLSTIKEKGKLVLGLDASFPPMGYMDEDMNIVGFDIDLAQEVCKRMGVELVLQPIEWAAKEQELDTKNIDVIWNGLSYSEDRANAMTLSQTYMKNNQVVVVLADSPINTLADLAGKTVAIQNGSTASDAMEEHKEVTDTLKELVKVNDNVQAMMDLKINGSDAVVMDEVVALYYMEKEAGTYRVLDETLAAEEYVIGFRKGDTALCQEIEKYLKEMKEDGTLATISTTWFGKDVNTIQ